MEIIKTKFKDLLIIKPTKYEDDRGFFYETFNEKKFNDETGLDIKFIQDNESTSHKGVLRGLHYQEGMFAQSKLVRVIKGSVLDVVVDMRPDSDTFGEHFSIVLTDFGMGEQLFVPKGFAHGFMALSEGTVFSYKCDNYYAPNFENGIYPFDKTLNIDWELNNCLYNLSEKDNALQCWEESIKKKVLVIGLNGQLGRCLYDLAGEYEELDITFLDRAGFDITNRFDVISHFSQNHYDYVVNASAYTNVDKAEIEDGQNTKVNAWGPLHLATACKKYDITLIHISSDYVFDGSKDGNYNEMDKTNPLNNYGKAKVKSEFAISCTAPKHYIIRTSWLYSEYRENFVKTMLKLGKEHKSLEVVGNQIGKPTYAGDLADFILQEIIVDNTENYGIYHYTGEDELTWYEFANLIMDRASLDTEIIRNDEYAPAIAKRPRKVCLDTSLASNTFKLSMMSAKYGIDRVIGKLR